MTLRIDPIPLAGDPLAEAYLAGIPEARSLYGSGGPEDPESYRDVLSRLRAQHEDTMWSSLAHALADGLLDAGGAGRERLNALIEERGAFVLTGQQAGLFTGPLYTLYKALTAARLAADLEGELGVPVLPLFWIASDDHDWTEVNHLYLVDLENRLRRLEARRDYEDVGGPGPPVFRTRLRDDIGATLQDLAEVTPDTEFKEEVLGPLREAYRPGRPYAEAFRGALEALLQGYPFLIVDAANEYVQRRTRDLLWREWELRAESAAAMIERVGEIEAAGYAPRVSIQEAATNLFVEGRSGRDRLLLADGKGKLRSSGEELTSEELRRILDTTPDRVSPGVLLGPVARSMAFPTLAQALGPGEIAYGAQSQPLFDLHGVPAPVPVARAAFRLVEARVEKVLRKYDLDPRDLESDVTATIHELVRRETPEEIGQALRALRARTGEALDRLEAAVIDYDPGAKSALGSGRHAIFESIAGLEGKLENRIREKHQVLEQQIRKAAVHLYPDGRPQERVLNIYPYLIRYGPDLVSQVYAKTVGLY